MPKPLNDFLPAMNAFDELLASAREQVSELESIRFNQMNDREDEYTDDDFEELKLASRLSSAYHALAILLEAAGLDSALARLAEDWSKVSPRETSWIAAIDVLDSPAYDVLVSYSRGLRPLISPPTDPTIIEKYNLMRLEDVLRDTASYVHKRHGDATKEADVEAVMHDVLDLAFDDFKPKPKIPGFLNNYIPDCGFHALGAIVEWKFAASEAELVKCVGEIFEDAGGYSGSKDWTRFYAVFYVTGPFVREAKLRAEMKRANLSHWTPFLAVGSGNRKAKKVAPAAP